MYSEDILNLNLVHFTLNKSLREISVGIKSLGEIPVNLFHAVNESQKRDKMVLLFPFCNEHSVTMIMDGLLSYLQFKYGNKVLDFLRQTLTSIKKIGNGTMRTNVS